MWLVVRYSNVGGSGKFQAIFAVVPPLRSVSPTLANFREMQFLRLLVL